MCSTSAKRRKRIASSTAGCGAGRNAAGLCAAVVAQMFFGGGFCADCGRSVCHRRSRSASGMIAAYARHGIWDAARKAEHARQCGLCAVLCAGRDARSTFGLHESVGELRCSSARRRLIWMFRPAVAADGLRQEAPVSSRATSWTMSNEMGDVGRSPKVRQLKTMSSQKHQHKDIGGQAVMEGVMMQSPSSTYPSPSRCAARTAKSW